MIIEDRKIFETSSKESEGMIIRELYQNPARRFSERTGIVSGNVRYTFKECEKRINQLINGLMELGLQKGDRVAIIDSNKPWYLQLYFGITGGGMIAVPLNYRLAPREYVYLLNQSGAKAVCVGEDYVQTINSIRDQVPEVEHFICPTFSDGYISFEELLQGASDQQPDVPISENDLATLGFTSGTTGLPKGAKISHKNIIQNAMNYLIELPLYPSDVCYNHFPMFHCGGYSLMGYYGRGLTQVYDDFALQSAFEVIEREKINYWYVPAGALAFVPGFSEHESYDVSSVRVIYTGGSATRNAVVESLFKMFPNLQSLHDIYGLTECTASVVARTITRGMLPQLDQIGEHCGPECFGVHARLVDDDDRDVPDGELGEVVVQSETTCQGYWDNPEETEKLLRNGWLHTGDIGRFDELRNLYIVDRKKDMILSGGENIASAEVENAIYMHPKVAEIAVIARPDPKWGEAVHAVVVPLPGEEITEQEIIDFCKQNIASYKKPKSVELMDALPRNPTGKVLKKDLRARFQA